MAMWDYINQEFARASDVDKMQLQRMNSMAAQALQRAQQENEMLVQSLSQSNQMLNTLGNFALGQGQLAQSETQSVRTDTRERDLQKNTIEANRIQASLNRNHEAQMQYAQLQTQRELSKNELAHQKELQEKERTLRKELAEMENKLSYDQLHSQEGQFDKTYGLNQNMNEAQVAAINAETEGTTWGNRRKMAEAEAGDMSKAMQTSIFKDAILAASEGTPSKTQKQTLLDAYNEVSGGDYKSWDKIEDKTSALSDLNRLVKTYEGHGQSIPVSILPPATVGSKKDISSDALIRARNMGATQKDGMLRFNPLTVPKKERNKFVENAMAIAAEANMPAQFKAIKKGFLSKAFGWDNLDEAKKFYQVEDK